MGTIEENWRWNWTSLCGPEGLSIWAPQRHDLGLCFQQLFLQIPVLALLGFASAYYCGKQAEYVSRGLIQIYSIKLRALLVLMLALLPVFQVYIDLNETQGHISWISFFLCAVQGICWFCHFVFILALRKRLGKSPRGPIVICVLWTLLFVLSVISLRSHIIIYKHDDSPNYSIYLAYSFSICRIILQISYVFTLLPGEGDTTFLNFNAAYTEITENDPLLHNPYVRFSEEGDPAYLGVAMEDTTWASKLLFYWVNPLMEKGVQGKLRVADDLYDLPVTLNCGLNSARLDKSLAGGDVCRKRRQRLLNDNASASVSSCSTPTSPDVSFIKIRKYRVSLLKALHRCFWVQFYSVGILKFVADCAGFASPMLLNRLVNFIETDSVDVKWGYLYATGLTFSTLIASICDSHFNFLISLVGLKMRGSIVTTIYRKTLTVSETALRSHFSVGEIVNFMSTDTDRIVNSCPSFHAFWSIPFQLGVTLCLLYYQVGIAFLAGVAFSVVLMPINKCIASKIGQLSSKLMEQKDSRVKLISEVLHGIKAIKLYVWEQHFIRTINKIRDNELKYLKGRKYLDALCVYFWATTPVLISLLTFATYVLLGNELTAATVFTTIALLNMLISPLNAFPWVLNGLMEAWISIRRIQRLLDLSDLDLEAYYDDSLLEKNPNCDIVIKNAYFNWGKELNLEEKKKLHSSTHSRRFLSKKDKKGKRVRYHEKSLEDILQHTNDVFSLNDITLSVRKGEFIGVIGTVGSGKSSFLSAILAELNMDQGEIAISQVESGFGFANQQPWLQRGTVRDNILFGKAYDDYKYKSVLFACGLANLVDDLPQADLTGIGESGTTLSGGQKARIALARAVYQDKAVYLLDDVLAAVDPPIAKHIFQHCIMGLLGLKTRVLCTHLVQYLVYADRIILFEDGVIKQQGKPANVLTDMDDSLTVDLELDLELSESYEASLKSVILDSMKEFPDEKKDNDSILNEEISEVGTVEFDVYASYWTAIGHLLSLLILFTLSMMQISRNMSDWWLSRWVSHQHNNSTNLTTYSNSNVGGTDFDPNLYEAPSMDSYLKIYVGFAAINSIFTFFRAFLFAYGGILAATKIHKLLLKSIMKAKSTFFDVSPLGRILNRFSSDVYTIDDSLPFILNILLAQFFGLIGTVFITMYGLPWICLILFPLIPVYHWLQHHYRLTSRELKRISSVTLSPVYSHFNESLQGLSTIRAMRATQRFKRENEDNVDSNLKAQFASQAAARWLGLRLQFFGVAMVAGVSFIAVIQHQFDVTDPGLVGLALSYALSITGALGGVVNAFTETEREMIAVERVNQYIKDVPSETDHFIIDPPFGWPSQGVVSFNDVVLKYREHLPPSLSNVTFETRPSEKIGVVGRTGAGKSSLIAALFRLAELSSGTISIDSVDISHISLASLRSRLFCIPQEPFLFSGTLKENLDPLGEFREHEIWHVLGKVNLSDTIKRLGGLDKTIDSSGSNFSVGQKQLICLARAILHNAKVLCIDEATANIDQETDRQIQSTLRSAFRKSTVIIIAHRIQTIADCDRIIVMNDGRIVEFDTPAALMSNPASTLYNS